MHKIFNYGLILYMYRRNLWLIGGTWVPNDSYILHCHGKCGIFTIHLKGNDMKNSKFGKS